MSEMFSSAVLAGVVAEAAPLAVVGTVTARVSVLPEVGSELPKDSDEAAVVCMVLMDAAVDDSLDIWLVCMLDSRVSERIRRMLCRGCLKSVV